MLLVLLGSYEGELTVLAVDSQVLDLDGVVVADRNAAAMIARFEPAMVGIEQLDEAAVYAEWWNDSLDAKQRRMAEVLVPDRVPPSLILRAYVSDAVTRRRLLDQLGARRLAVHVNRSLFFNRGRQ